MLSLLSLTWLLLLLLVPTNSWEVHLFSFVYDTEVVLWLILLDSSANDHQWDGLSVILRELYKHQQEITWPSKWLPQSSPHWLVWSDVSSSQDPSCYHALRTGHELLMKTAPLQRIISQLYLSVIVYEWISWQQGAKWMTGIAKHF